MAKAGHPQHTFHSKSTGNTRSDKDFEGSLHKKVTILSEANSDGSSLLAKDKSNDNVRKDKSQWGN